MQNSPRDDTVEVLLGHAEWIRGLARTLVKDSGVAEDIVQDAWVLALDRPPGQLTNPRGWLAAVVRSLVRDRARGETSRGVRERRAAREEAVTESEELTARAEMQRNLIEHVLELDEVYRSVLLLRFYEGMAPPAIARTQGVPVATVRTRLARGLEKLRAKLDASRAGNRSEWVLALVPIIRGQDGTLAIPQAPPAGTRRIYPVAAAVMVLAGSLVLVVYLARNPAEPDSTKRLAGSLGTSAVESPGLSVPQSKEESSARQPASIGFTATTQERDQARAPSSAPSELTPVTVFSQEHFNPSTEGPRAITLDPTGVLYVFEYGKDGKCIRFDRAGTSPSLNKPIGYCSEALIVGGWLYVTRPGGELVRLDPVTLDGAERVSVEDTGGHWLCNALCGVNGNLHVASGDMGRVYVFSSDLRPLGTWDIGGQIAAMDAVGDAIFVARRDGGAMSTLISYRGTPDGLAARDGPELEISGDITDLCALDETRVIVVNETGELLQYARGTDPEPISPWTLQGNTDLSKEAWFAPPGTVQRLSRAAYDLRSETLYLSFSVPHARIVAVPYSAESSSRVLANK